MAQRSSSQRTGALGHKWLALHVEESGAWLARELSEDFGIDMEFELTEPAVRGDILKIQIKSTENAVRKNGLVRFEVDRRYKEYASTCRYPVILVLVDTKNRQAWYLWLQDWLFHLKNSGSATTEAQLSWTVWVPDNQTVATGLSGQLKNIARWEGETQLVLSLMDSLRTAMAIGDQRLIDSISSLIDVASEKLSDEALNHVIGQAIDLGNMLRTTYEGNQVATTIFALVRKLGYRISFETVSRLVIRDETYSRVGLAALGILYDEYPEHMRSLELPHRFSALELRVAFYCALREACPNQRGFLRVPPGFTYAGLKYEEPDTYLDKYMNRGPSAILDYLSFIEPPGDK